MHVYAFLQTQSARATLAFGDVVLMGQLRHAALVLLEYEPPGQSEHVVSPWMTYLPATQAVHDVGLALANPELHTHESTLGLRGPENEFTGQFKHV